MRNFTANDNSKTQYPVGAQTIVTYDPDDPSRNYLGSNPPNMHSLRMASIITGGFLLLAGALTFFKMKNQY